MRSPIQFLLPCPTSSATRAQVWYELRSGGLQVLTIGLVLAIVLALLFASGRGGRAFGMIIASLSVPVVLLIGNNAFGLRRRQGGSPFSAFEATQPHGTMSLAIVKVLVRSVCFLTAVSAVWATAWICLSRFRPLKEGQSAIAQANNWMLRREADFAALPGYEQLALVFVVVLGIVVWVAARNVVRAIWVRNFRYVIVAASLPLLFILAGVALSYDLAPQPLRPVLEHGIRWVIEAGIVFTTIYVLRSGLAERLLTRRYVWGVALISAAFAAAWVTVLDMNDIRFATIPAMQFDAHLFPALLVPWIGALVPWAFSRIRHT